MVSIICENIELWVAYKSNQRKKAQIPNVASEPKILLLVWLEVTN